MFGLGSHYRIVLLVKRDRVDWVVLFLAVLMINKCFNHPQNKLQTGHRVLITALPKPPQTAFSSFRCSSDLDQWMLSQSCQNSSLQKTMTACRWQEQTNQFSKPGGATECQRHWMGQAFHAYTSQNNLHHLAKNHLSSSHSLPLSATVFSVWSNGQVTRLPKSFHTDLHEGWQ